MLAHVGSEITLLQSSQAEHHSDVPDGYGLIDYKVNTPITCESVVSWCICNHMRLQTHKSKTAQIVLDLLGSRDMTQSALADEIGMSRQVLSNKLNGIRSFTKRDYVALADFFNTSVDYLMGRTLDPWPADNPQPEEAAK